MDTSVHFYRRIQALPNTSLWTCVNSYEWSKTNHVASSLLRKFSRPSRPVLTKPYANDTCRAKWTSGPCLITSSRVEWFLTFFRICILLPQKWIRVGNLKKNRKNIFHYFEFFRSRIVFLWKRFGNIPLKKVRFFLSKYDFMSIKKSVILWRFQK